MRSARELGHVVPGWVPDVDMGHLAECYRCGRFMVDDVEEGTVYGHVASKPCSGRRMS